MFVKFILLVTIACIAAQVVDEDDNEPQSSPRTDAQKLANLRKEYIERTPYEPIRGSYKTRCRIIQECCPNQRNHLFNILQESQLEQKCIGTKDSTLYNSHSGKCQSLIKHYDDILRSPESAEYWKTFTDLKRLNDRVKNLHAKMEKACSTSELTAFYCEPENMEPFRSCMEKVLRMVDRQNGGRGYADYFVDFKNNYGSLIQQVTNKYPYLRR